MGGVQVALSIQRTLLFVSRLGGLANRVPLLRTPVAVLKPDDVALPPQILPALHFNQSQFDHAGVFQSVAVADGNVGRFIGTHQEFLVAADHFGGVADHDSVLAAVVVHLQRQRGAGFDFDALDFVADALFQHGAVRCQR